MDNSNSGSDPEEDVFEQITEPVENVQDYVPGGRHPVYLGDVVGGGKYKIIRKLGYGGYSTVWLVQDLKWVSITKCFAFSNKFFLKKNKER